MARLTKMFNIFVTVNGTKHSKPTMAFIITKNNFDGTIDVPNLTQNRNFNLPDTSGNLIVDSQLSAVALSGSYNDLLNKPSFPATPKAYVTQTWRSGASWYRRWSNGWIEQGGLIDVSRDTTIRFPIAFSSTPPTCVVSPAPTYSANTVYVGAIKADTLSSTGFTGYVTDINGNKQSATRISWYACGY